MAWTLTTSGAAIRKAGLNANSTITASGAALQDWSDQTEASINAVTRYDWVTNYASINEEFKQALARAASALIAINIINYDMSGYTSRTEAQTMLDVLDNEASDTINIIKEKQNQEKMK